MEIQTFEFYKELIDNKDFVPTLEKYCRYDLVNSISIYNKLLTHFQSQFENYPSDSIERIVRVNLLITLRYFGGILTKKNESVIDGLERLQSYITKNIVSNIDPYSRIKESLTSDGKPLVSYCPQLKLVEVKQIAALIGNWYHLKKDSDDSINLVFQEIIIPVLKMVNNGTEEEFELTRIIENHRVQEENRARYVSQMSRTVTFDEFYNLLDKISTNQVIESFYPFIFGKVDFKTRELYSMLGESSFVTKKNINLFLIVKSLDLLGTYPDTIDIIFKEWISINCDLESVWLNGIGSILKLNIGQYFSKYLEYPNESSNNEIKLTIIESIRESIGYKEKQFKDNLYNLLILASKNLGDTFKLQKQTIMNILQIGPSNLIRYIEELIKEGKIFFSNKNVYQFTIVFSTSIS